MTDAQRPHRHSKNSGHTLVQSGPVLGAGHDLVLLGLEVVVHVLHDNVELVHAAEEAGGEVLGRLLRHCVGSGGWRGLFL